MLCFPAVSSIPGNEGKVRHPARVLAHLFALCAMLYREVEQVPLTGVLDAFWADFERVFRKKLKAGESADGDSPAQSHLPAVRAGVCGFQSDGDLPFAKAK